MFAPFFRIVQVQPKPKPVWTSNHVYDEYLAQAMVMAGLDACNQVLTFWNMATDDYLTLRKCIVWRYGGLWQDWLNFKFKETALH